MADSIIRCTEFDLLRTNVTDGNIYACVDSRKLYQDVGKVRVLLDCVQITTEKKRAYDTVPSVGKKYYVWETSELWLWQNAWVKLIGNPNYPEAYQYIDGDIYRVGNQGQSTYVDNNGMLGDGGVVIRDLNRIIKGKLSIDDTSDNLIISSFLGGGMKLLPNGSMEETGALYLDVDEKGTAVHYNDFMNYNGQIKVKYDEFHRDDDPAMYPNSEHTYNVWHEGNLDATPLINDELLRKDYESQDGRGGTSVDNSVTSNGFLVDTKNNDLLSEAGFRTYNYWNDRTPVLNEIFIQSQEDPAKNSRIMGIKDGDNSYAFYLTYDSDRPTSVNEIDPLTKILNKREIEQLINSKVRIALIDKVTSTTSVYRIDDEELTRFLKDGYVMLVRFGSDSTMRKIQINVNDLITYDVDDNTSENQQPLFFKSGNIYQFVINGSKLILLNNDMLATTDNYGNVMVTNSTSPTAVSFSLVEGSDVNLNDQRYMIEGRFAIEGMLMTKSNFPVEESDPDVQTSSYMLDVKESTPLLSKDHVSTLSSVFTQTLTNIHQGTVYQRSYNAMKVLNDEFERGGISGDGESEDSPIYVRQKYYMEMLPEQNSMIYTDMGSTVQFKIFEYDNFKKVAESVWRPANQAYIFTTNAKTKYARLLFRYSDDISILEVDTVSNAVIKVGSNQFSGWKRVYPVIKDEFANYETLEVKADGWEKNVDTDSYEYNVKRIFVNDKTLVEGTLDLDNKDKLGVSYIDSYIGGFKIIAKLLPKDDFVIDISYQRTQEVA